MPQQTSVVPDRTDALLTQLRWWLIVCAAVTLWELFYPFNFQRFVITHWLTDRTIGKLNTAGNILLFMPLGLVSAWRSRLLGRGRASAVLAATLLGAAASLFGETLQIWLPERFSSIIDLVANTIGAGAGAVMGWQLGPILTHRWGVFSGWFATRPVAKQTLFLTLAVLVIKTAPFDISPETFYMRWALWDAYTAGWPFSAVMYWRSVPNPDAMVERAAMMELARAGLNMVVFSGLTVSIGRAVRESALRKGDRAYPIDVIILVGMTFVVGMELLQWPVRSRLMDATDVLAGVVGVSIVAGVSWMRNHARHR